MITVRKYAIADPPYPPFVGSGGQKNRASRWYGTKQRSRKDTTADVHPEAAEWDNPARHRQLLEELLDTHDGFAIATSVDGLAAYGTLPVGTRIMAWIKTNAIPGSHRLRSMWEPVILYPAIGRRSNRGGVGIVPDVWTGPAPRGFKGQKPEGWTHWVLDALTFDPDADHVADMFPGSGAVAAAVETYYPSWKRRAAPLPPGAKLGAPPECKPARRIEDITGSAHNEVAT